MVDAAGEGGVALSSGLAAEEDGVVEAVAAAAVGVEDSPAGAAVSVAVEQGAVGKRYES